MATNNSVQTLDGLFKQVYSDKVLTLLPEFSILGKMVPFASPSEQLGGQFKQPVVLTDEHGVTYAGPSSTNTTLEDAVAGQTSFATVDGSNFFIRSILDYQTLMKAKAKGVGAFASATQHVVKRMVATAAKRLEMSRLYGQSGIASVASVGTVTAGVQTLVISVASWSGGIWMGMTQAKLDSYTTGGTKINTNAALVVTSVDPSTRTVSVSGNSTDLAALATSQVLYFRGSYGQEMIGLDKIATTAGSLFGIDNTVYDAFRGNTYDCGSTALSMQHVLKAADKGVVRGLMGNATLLINPSVWTQLNTDQAALRDYDVSYDGKKAETGVEAIVYHYSGGKISVVAHPLVKQGDGFLFREEDLKRIGASELTFADADGKVVLQVANSAAKELRAMANEAIFVERPANLVKLINIALS